MLAEQRDEITREMVEELWTEAIAGLRPTADINRRAEALLNLGNAESPVVNWGLTDLHRLTRPPVPTRDDLVRTRTAWQVEVRRYGADPAVWMRRYFQDMIRDFTHAHGQDRGRAFAAKLVRGGHLTESDVPPEVDE